MEINKIEEICKNSNIKPKVSIRINTLKTTKEKLKNNLLEKQINVQDGILKDFLILDKVKNIEMMLVVVQEEKPHILHKLWIMMLKL